jgi:RNA dependent RNA polymerase
MELVELGLLREPETIKLVKKTITERMLPEATQGLHIPLEKARRILIIPDPTGLLKPGQVFLQISDHWEASQQASGRRPAAKDTRKVIEGAVLLARNPCHHPDDLQAAQAVELLSLIPASSSSGEGGEAKKLLRAVARHTACGLEKDSFGDEWHSALFSEASADGVDPVSPLRKLIERWRESLIDVVVLPASEAHCKVSPASKLSGGDYDGDTAFVTWEPLLVTEEVLARKKASEELASAAQAALSSAVVATPSEETKAVKKKPAAAVTPKKKDANGLPQLGGGFDFSFLSSSASDSSSDESGSSTGTSGDENEAPGGAPARGAKWSKKELQAALASSSSTSKATESTDLLLSSLGPAASLRDFLTGDGAYDDLRLPAWLALHYADSFKPDSPANLLGKATNLHLAWMDYCLEQRDKKRTSVVIVKTTAAATGAGAAPVEAPLTAAHEREPLELAKLCSDLVDAGKKGNSVLEIPQRLRNIRYPSYLWSNSASSSSSSSSASSSSSGAVSSFSSFGGINGESSWLSASALAGGSSYRTTRPSNSPAAQAMKAVQSLVNGEKTAPVADSDGSAASEAAPSNIIIPLQPFQQPHPILQSASERCGWYKYQATANEHLAAYLKDVTVLNSHLKHKKAIIPTVAAAVEARPAGDDDGANASASSASYSSSSSLDGLAGSLASKLTLGRVGDAATEKPTEPVVAVTSWQQLHTRARERFDDAVRSLAAASMEKRPAFATSAMSRHDLEQDVAHGLALAYYMAVWERHLGGSGSSSGTGTRRLPSSSRWSRQHPPPSFAWLVARKELICALKQDIWRCKAMATRK